MGRDKRPPAKAGLQSEPPKKPCLPGSQKPTEQNIAWRFDLLHRQGGFFGWDTLRDGELEQLMLKLKDFEAMSVEELFHNYKRYPGKYYGPWEIPNRDALKVIEGMFDDQDRVYLLRLWGSCRVFGFLSGNVFNILWWDPEHKVWPTDPD